MTLDPPKRRQHTWVRDSAGTYLVFDHRFSLWILEYRSWTAGSNVIPSNHIFRSEPAGRRQADQTTPWSIMASTTLTKPAMLAPAS